MPGPLLHAYAAMLPRLQAEESLRHATEIAVGTGSLKERESKRIFSDWQREAAGPQPQLSPEQLASQMAAWGIPVQQVSHG